jgi:hypothetical protein
MSLTYGYDLNDGDDFMEAPIQAVELVSRIVLPGAVLVNHFPFCASILSHPCMCLTTFSVRHIHSWIPFLSYELLIRRGRELCEKIKNGPIDFVKNDMVRGSYAPTIYFYRPWYSIMAQPFRHLRVSICRS